jgi:hypothetical protein
MSINDQPREDRMSAAAGTAKGTKLIDNDRVTVWEWRFPKLPYNVSCSLSILQSRAGVS